MTESSAVTPPGRIRRGVLRLAAVIAVILAAIAGAEALLALFDFPPAPTEHQRLFVEYDSLLGWRNIPGSHGKYVTNEFEVELAYNARAYRGPLHPYAKPAGTYRVVMVGDSYLEGYTVVLSRRAPEVAQVMLQPLPVEIVALGTGGYSTDQELLWLQSEGLRYRPDLVVVLFAGNDIWFNNRGTYPRGSKPIFKIAGDSLALSNVPVPRPRPSTDSVALPPTTLWLAMKRAIGLHSRLVRLARRMVRRDPWLHGLMGHTASSTSPATEESAGVDSLYSVFADRLTPQADTAVIITERLLARMRSMTRAAGAELTVMLVPAREALYPPGAPQSRDFSAAAPYGDKDRLSRRFREICAAAGVRCVDPTARFVSAAQALPRGELLIFPEDGHWNERGHAVAGASLADLVRETIGARVP
jgi:GDSL-like lipase/acylhydrolase family protein